MANFVDDVRGSHPLHEDPLAGETSTDSDQVPLPPAGETSTGPDQLPHR